VAGRGYLNQKACWDAASQIRISSRARPQLAGLGGAFARQQQQQQLMHLPCMIGQLSELGWGIINSLSH
jgi:hypothetical protein